MKVEKLPNLQEIYHHIVDEINKAKEKKGYEPLKERELIFDRVEIFKQVWGSTTLGFDINEDKMATFGGCAMTEAYTTVMREEHTHLYFVIFDNRLCYCVDNPTNEFFEDLDNKQLACLSKAQNRY